MMDLDEMLAIMAASIYAARLNVYVLEPRNRAGYNWQEWRNEAMRLSVSEARMIWEITHAVARK